MDYVDNPNFELTEWIRPANFMNIKKRETYQPKRFDIIIANKTFNSDSTPTMKITKGTKMEVHKIDYSNGWINVDNSKWEETEWIGIVNFLNISIYKDESIVDDKSTTIKEKTRHDKGIAIKKKPINDKSITEDESITINDKRSNDKSITKNEKKSNDESISGKKSITVKKNKSNDKSIAIKKKSIDDESNTISEKPKLTEFKSFKYHTKKGDSYQFLVDANKNTTESGSLRETQQNILDLFQKDNIAFDHMLEDVMHMVEINENSRSMSSMMRLEELEEIHSKDDVKKFLNWVNSTFEKDKNDDDLSDEEDDISFQMNLEKNFSTKKQTQN